MPNNIENIEESYRFRLGRKHGAEDKDDDIDSDTGYFRNSGFYKTDKAYCSGYELGYLEGKSKKKDR